MLKCHAIIPAEAAASFTAVWDRQLAADIGARLTCREADALAELLRSLAAPDLADAWIEEHAAGDDAEDAHYRAPAEGAQR